MSNIVVGISGGIDSAASTLLLKEQCRRCTGVMLHTCGEAPSQKEVDTLASKLNIDIIVKDVRNAFSELVVEPFLDSYVAGETPSPCSLCNPLIKWRFLKEAADEIYGPQTDTFWATGHYCRKEFFNGKYYIKRGIDPIKDQSYYLWRLPQDILAGMMLPLGEMRKSEVRELMLTKGFETLVERRESMSVCFIPSEGYSEVLLQRRPELKALNGGDIVTTAGELLGKHSGYPFYTIAQRRGLPISKGRCVVDIDSVNNRVIIGSPEELFCRSFIVRDWLAVDESELMTEKRISVVVRGVGENPSGYCRIEKLDDNRLAVSLDGKGAWALTKGQPVVFYIDDRVIAGGVVSSVF